MGQLLSPTAPSAVMLFCTSSSSPGEPECSDTPSCRVRTSPFPDPVSPFSPPPTLDCPLEDDDAASSLHRGDGRCPLLRTGWSVLCLLWDDEHLSDGFGAGFGWTLGSGWKKLRLGGSELDEVFGEGGRCNVGSGKGATSPQRSPHRWSSNFSALGF